MIKHWSQSTPIHFIELNNEVRVVKVKIISDIEDRINEEVRHDNISTTKTLYLLKKEDEEYRN